MLSSRDSVLENSNTFELYDTQDGHFLPSLLHFYYIRLILSFIGGLVGNRTVLANFFTRLGFGEGFKTLYGLSGFGYNSTASEYTCTLS